VSHVTLHKHRKMQEEFLKLSPAQRVDMMDQLFLEGLEFFAYQKGISIDEAYKEINRRDKFFTE
jgi:hypothetical protein